MKMTAYLYDEYNNLLEVIRDCTCITPTFVKYINYGMEITRYAKKQQWFSRSKL